MKVKKFVLGVCLCLVMPLWGTASDRTGLVGEWTFNDGTAKDTSGNGNDGSGEAANVEGISGRAFEFDGSQSISVDQFSTNFKFTKNFTLEVWVYPTQGCQTMVRKGGNANFLLELGVGRTNDPGTNPQFGFATNTVAIGSSIVNGPELPLKKWTFLTMSYDGEKMRGYINGELAVENTVTGNAINDNSQPLLFGNYSTEQFYGRLDEIRIWARTLSDKEILADFEALAPNLKTNLVGEWLFEGDAKDTSGNGNDGEPSGDATLAEGISGQGYEYFGDGVVTVSNFSENFVFQQEFSLAAWVMPTAGCQTMIRKGGDANFLLELGVGRTNDPGTTPQFGFATSAVNIGSSITIGPVLPLNQWSFLTMTYDGSDLKGYLNGVLVADNKVTGNALNNTSQALMFGRYSTEVFYGKLDEIRIWSRTLRVKEITDLFAQNASKPNVSKYQKAERIFDDLTYTPGKGIPAIIEVNGQSGTVSLSETPPAGWAVTNISNNGQWVNGVIQWNIPDFTGSLTLSYVVTPPASATGSGNFAGKIGENDITGFTSLVPGKPIEIFENHMDIGAVVDAGTAVYNSSTKTYTVDGGGKEIWNHLDEMHFVYLRVSGDFSLKAKVDLVPLTSSETWAKVGLVVRDDLAPNSAYGVIFVRPDYQMSFEWRPIKGVYPDRTGTLRTLDEQDGQMEIARVGKVYRLYYIDINTGNRVLFSSLTPDWVDPVYVGLEVSASLSSIGDGIGLMEGLFTNVTFTGPVSVADWSLY